MAVLDRMRSGISGVRRLRELAFLDAFLVIVVVVVTFALMTAVLARLVSASEPGEGDADESALPVVTAEIPLGDFRFVVHGRAFSNDSGDMLYAIEFGAMALVTDTSPGIRRTERAIEARQFRIRGLVDEIARKSTREALGEPDLKTIRTAIRAEVNKLFGTTLIHDVLFSQFRFYEIPRSL